MKLPAISLPIDFSPTPMPFPPVGEDVGGRLVTSWSPVGCVEWAEVCFWPVWLALMPVLLPAAWLLAPPAADWPVMEEAAVLVLLELRAKVRCGMEERTGLLTCERRERSGTAEVNRRRAMLKDEWEKI